MDKRTYEVTIESPHGIQPIERWRHWMGKVADEAEERWGIMMSIERSTDESATKGEFE